VVECKEEFKDEMCRCMTSVEAVDLAFNSACATIDDDDALRNFPLNATIAVGVRLRAHCRLACC
jgi:hypothetical protein